MSDDENNIYNRSSVMNRYLYGTSSGDTDGASNEDDNAKRRSKSTEPSSILNDAFTNGRNRTLSPGMTRIRTKEIERHVTWKNVQSLVNSQNNRLLSEKEELNQLNKRLDQLVESIKIKKAQNDDLQETINKYREDLMCATVGKDGPSKLKAQYTQDLNEAKRELNDVSEMSSMSKIRASRSMYELDRLREQFDTEMKYQSNNREKIRMLENQRAESLHELSYLKENCESRTKSVIDDQDRNEKLRQQLKKLSDELDREQENRVDLECKIQTLIEQKKFNLDLNRVMKDELDKMFVYQGEHRLFDPQTFYNAELREIKERIREDFKKLNEYNLETMREEYEYKYVQTVEEIEISRRNAEAARAASGELDAMNFSNLNDEFNRNSEELKALKVNEFKANQVLEELRKRLNETQINIEFESSSRNKEIQELDNKINCLKNDLSSMLGFSKALDAEVAVYARLLNERFSQYVSHTVETNYSGSSDSQFSYDKYKSSIFKPKPSDSVEAENRRRMEQEELRKKQLELEENHRRLKELEIERERERIRKQAELEEQRRRQKEIEEQQRRQQELEEQQQRKIREQRELELKRQRELEEQQRRQQREQEEELRRRRELEEQQRRQKEQEEELRRRRELEEQQRKQREIEEHQRRLREIEEQQRKQAELEIRRQRELEEQRRQKEAEMKRQREIEENQRRQMELEEQQRRRRAEIEEQQRQQREIEEQQRRIRECEENRKRAEAAEEQQRRREEQDRKRQRDYEEQQRKQFESDEQMRKKREYEMQLEREDRERERERQRRQKELDEQQAMERRRIQAEETEKLRRQKEQEEYIYQQQLIIEQQKRQKEFEHQQQQIFEQKRRQREIELEKERERLGQETLVDRERQLNEIEQKRRQQREIELERDSKRVVVQETLINKERQLKEIEQERQKRLQQEREEHEKYILEKLRQEQELVEVQQRKKLIQEQKERERQQSQQQTHKQIRAVDNISSYTKRIVEEKHKSTEFFEEHRVEHVPISVPVNQCWSSSTKAQKQQSSGDANGSTYEKEINIKLSPLSPAQIRKQQQHQQQQTSQQNEAKSYRKETAYPVNIVDHCLSSNNGHKHVLIVNSYRPQSTVTINTTKTANARSQSPPCARNLIKHQSNGKSTEIVNNKQSADAQSNNNKYAIKHKANRYVSGAIGILETSLNGEYIILENLSSNKNVNLKGWYIHRYVPDQNINVIFKFNQDTVINSGEKLKILSKSFSARPASIRSTSMHEGLNKTNQFNSNPSAATRSCTENGEKSIVAHNVENWGTYSKFSVTKLINPEGVDKAVLTQSLLRLASSTNNLNAIASSNECQQTRQTKQNSTSTHNLCNNKNYIEIQTNGCNKPQKLVPCVSYAPAPVNETIRTTTTKTVTSTSSSSSAHHHHHQSSSHQAIPVSLVRAQPAVVDACNSTSVHVTRQF